MPSGAGDPPSTPNSSQIAALEAGLAAYKQGDIQAAIARLEAIPFFPNHPLSVKAQMAIAATYARQGQPQRVVEICEMLRSHPEPAVQTWVDQTFAKLAKRYPEIVAETSESADPTEPRDRTGFVPLTAPSKSDRTGFVPLTPPSESRDSPLGRLRQRSLESTPKAPPRPTQRIRSRPQSSQSSQSSASTESQPATPPPSPSQTAHQWRNADRPQHWKPIAAPKPIRLHAIQIATVFALFSLLRVTLETVHLQGAIALTRIPFFRSFISTYAPDHFWLTIWIMAISLVGSRWILDAFLKFGYGMKPYALSQLKEVSPETGRSLMRWCNQFKIPMPDLGIIPTEAPIAISYGVLPKFTRIVVSDRLLKELSDEEVATLYAMQVANIGQYTVPLMSMISVLLHYPYLLYQAAAEWAKDKTVLTTRWGAGLATTVGYSLYAMLRWVAVLASRERIEWSDRAACNLTGNPNGLSRALLKCAIATASDVHTQGKTAYLLEGLDLISPISPSATTLGSMASHMPLETILKWEWTHPLRRWMAINNSHPTMGDRLNRLTLYARQWRVESELDPESGVGVPDRTRGLTARQWRQLIWQGAPFFGLLFGWIIGNTLSEMSRQVWLLFRIQSFLWMYSEDGIVTGLPLIGFGIGTLLRINAMFPDIPKQRAIADLPTLLDTDTLPVQGQPVQLEGKLIGRADMGNWLSQDLLLQTSQGLIRLHWLSAFGPLGNIVINAIRPTDLLQKPVKLTGWFRRGATPWIDVDMIYSNTGQIHKSQHPIWSTAIAAIAFLWGLRLLIW